MANLVRYALSKGIEVAGYDRTPSALSKSLEREGAHLFYTDNPALIPPQFLNPEQALTVYTPAVPESNAVLTALRASGVKVEKRAALLGRITARTKAICVAGSHGKTTTSSMVANIMRGSRLGCNAFLGGVLRNTGSNLVLSADSEWSVAEADEYDRSFHHLSPTIAIITSTDPDHLDIYGNEANYLESFARFTELIRCGGTLLLHTGLKLHPRQGEGVRVITYSGSSEGDCHAENIVYGPGTLSFDFVGQRTRIDGIRLGAPVEINIDNAVAAAAASLLAGATQDEVRRGLETFLGAKRRFEVHLKGDEPGADGRVLIDDYAHSPNEVRASIESVRRLYPGRRISVIFQPHLYSRTRDFAPEFGEALSAADEVILTEIYPARELPIPGVSSELVLRAIHGPQTLLTTRADLLNCIKKRNFDVLMTLGAADIDRAIPDIIHILTTHNV